MKKIQYRVLAALSLIIASLGVVSLSRALPGEDYAPLGLSMQRQLITYGVRLEMDMPNIVLGDDTAYFWASNQNPQDSRFLFFKSIVGAEVVLNGIAFPMNPPSDDTGYDRWSLTLPQGWSAGVNSVGIRTYGSDSKVLFASSTTLR